MIGILLSDIEGMELEYLIMRELDEIRTERTMNHHPIVQRAIAERYKLLLKILIRIDHKSEY